MCAQTRDRQAERTVLIGQIGNKLKQETQEQTNRYKKAEIGENLWNLLLLEEDINLIILWLKVPLNVKKILGDQSACCKCTKSVILDHVTRALNTRPTITSDQP